MTDVDYYPKIVPAGRTCEVSVELPAGYDFTQEPQVSPGGYEGIGDVGMRLAGDCMVRGVYERAIHS